MEFFNRLGALVETRWREKNFANDAFAEVAQTAIQELPPSEHVTRTDIFNWVLSHSPMPQQDLESQFGDPPITLYRGDLFYIEALVWLDGTTSIHEHSFSGAFHVLEGSSLQSQYSFEPLDRINSRTIIGDLQLKAAEVLNRGATRPIVAGSSLIHGLFHLDHPSITIVVRTLYNPEDLPQYTYLRPGLARPSSAQHSRREKTSRQVQVLNALRRTSQAEYVEAAKHLVARADFETVILLLHDCFANDRALLPELLEHATAVHGRERVGFLEKVFAQIAREELLVRLRKVVHDPEQRYFLALLLNLPNRHTIYELLRERFQRDPVEMIMSWLEGFGRRSSEPEFRELIDLSLDEPSLLLIRCLLRDFTWPQVQAEFEVLYDAEEVSSQREALQEMCDDVRVVPFFEPLFR